MSDDRAQNPSRLVPNDLESHKELTDTTVAAGDSHVDTDEVPPLTGTFGRYELRKLLGQGGMGSVYLARDPQLERDVALKIPKLEGADPSQWRDRFFSEARAAATFTHPNICPVFDIGEEGETPYITMAYIPGETLASKLEREGPFDPAPAVELVKTVARAIGDAHRKGIVHRDLKPANLMLDGEGRPLIMDFGLALRPTTTDDLRMTLTGVALGTPAYMPPEQAGGDHEAIGTASDVYSLGVILYELVTGQVPFKGRTFGQLLAQIERDAPPPPSSLRNTVNPALEAIIMKALAKSPADRFANASELADALARYQSGDQVALVAEFGKPYVIPGPEGQQPVPASSTALPNSNRWAWGIALTALLLVIAIAGTSSTSRPTTACWKSN